MQPAVNSGENTCEECGISQLPFWDFFECNKSTAVREFAEKEASQFPLWDFGECNFMMKDGKVVEVL
jgi:hypothetical protein